MWLPIVFCPWFTVRRCQPTGNASKLPPAVKLNAPPQHGPPLPIAGGRPSSELSRRAGEARRHVPVRRLLRPGPRNTLGMDWGPSLVSPASISLPPQVRVYFHVCIYYITLLYLLDLYYIIIFISMDGPNPDPGWHPGCANQPWGLRLLDPTLK